MKFETVKFLDFCEVNGIPYEKNEISKIDSKKAQELSSDGKIKIMVSDAKLKNKMPITNLRSSLDTVKQYVSTMQPIFYDEAKNWWVWDFEDNYWSQIDEISILNQLEDSLEILELNKSGVMHEYLNAFKMAGRRIMPNDIPSKWIQFQNCIVDLNVSSQEKAHKIEASSKYFLCNPIPHKFLDDPCVETPFFDSLFEAWVGKEWKQTLYELLGYCLIPEYKIHLIFFLVGSGRNGKSTFLRILRTLLGMENVTTSTLERLDPRISRFETATLYKKLACLIGETDFAVMRNTSLLKMLSGEDLISAEFKGKLPFQFVNYSKPIISTNSLPTPNDKTEGWDRRAFVIDFPNKFPEGKDILENVPEGEYDKLATKCIYALIDLLKRGTFTNQGSIEERAQRYEERSNPTLKFIKDNYVKDPDGETWLWEFKNGLDAYLLERKYHKIIDKREVSKLLTMLGFETVEERIYQNDGKERRWVKIFGLKRKEMVQLSLENQPKDVWFKPLPDVSDPSDVIPHSAGTIQGDKEVTSETSQTSGNNKSVEYILQYISPEIDITTLYNKLMMEGWQIEQIDSIVEDGKNRSIIFSPRSGIIRRV